MSPLYGQSSPSCKAEWNSGDSPRGNDAKIARNSQNQTVIWIKIENKGWHHRKVRQSQPKTQWIKCQSSRQNQREVEVKEFSRRWIVSLWIVQI